MPEGFENAKAPTLNERVAASFGSLLALVAPARPNTESASPVLPPPGTVGFDFDGDGKADIGRWHPSTTDFRVKNSGGGTYSTFILGPSSSILAPADYDGDGKTDAAVFNAGTWTIKKSSDGQTTVITGFGRSGDVPVAGNYMGTSAADLAYYRPSNGTWYFREVSNSTITSSQFGNAGDVAVPGNYDGDALMDLAVFRPSTGDWHVSGSSAGYYVFHWGLGTDLPVPADYDGDGKTDHAVYRGSSGTWYAYKSGQSGQYFTQAWGNYGDQPVPADYDGDGKADFSVWRPTTGVWHTIKSATSAYDYQTLGVAGDTAIPSAYLKQIGGAVLGYDLAQARLSPKNSTGGTDLYSRNFSWGTSLVGLPGRAGLSAGFGISYNSLVWTKSGSAVYFDADTSNVSPGFRFGYPVIEPAYYDTAKQTFAYLMVTPSGARVEFRQTAVGSTYETADSSYAQLKTKGADSPNDPVEDIAITVTGTDGTKMSYQWKAGAYRCSQIKDRNGNYLTIFHDDQGLLKTVTDTLGRVITVNYDTQLYPTSITQTWKDNNGGGSNVTHIWASFAYTTTNNPPINTNFSGLNVIGPQNGTILKVLERVSYPDGSWTKFTYNSYGQVFKVQNHAADGHELNRVRTDLETPAANQTDCPKFGQTISYVENFNGGAETVVNNTLATGYQVTDLDGATVAASLIQVSMQNHPTGNITNTYVGQSGWMESLPIRTDDYANGNGLELKRSSWTKWTQDNPTLGYILNPRVTETKVGDAANTRRSTVEYRLLPNTTIAEYGLVSAVNVLDGQSAVLKRVETDYNLAAAYTSRRIIGLPLETRVYGYENSALPLVSKMTYAYDEEDFAQEPNQNIDSVIQHDNSAFSASFIIGRGNLTSTSRHDVTGQTASVTSRVRYDIAGSPVAQIDPLNRKVAINYTDVFNDSANRNAFAYPTTITDPANNSSTVKYRFDIGANIEANSPAPVGNTYGMKTKRIFDEKGQLSKNAVWINTTEHAYTRYEYPENGTQAKIYSTITDSNSDGVINSSDEVLSERFYDGAGRTRNSRSPMLLDADGNTLTWVGQKVEYDIIGRLKRQTAPTEVDNSWNPTNDDSSRGWQWNSKEFDWKGRVTRDIGLDGIDRLYSYEGCGCAGGEITTIMGELVNGERRTQKIYADILGRDRKSELLDYDDNVYSTVVKTFNGRDQAISVKQFQGAEGSTTFQETTATYDGHGRLKTQHLPQQDANAETAYSYNADDRPQSMTDGRGSISGYTYNEQGLVTRIDRSLPGASTNFPTINPNSAQVSPTPPLPCGPEHPNYPDCLPEPQPSPSPSPTPNPEPYLSWATFNYDALGNRTQMVDSETGTTNYEYDQLSRMTAEHKIMRSSWNLPNSTFTIGYGYDLTGRLSSVTDPFGDRIDYKIDKIGRLKQITGTPFSSSNSTGGTVSVTDYIDNINYRAWGAVKSIDYGNSTNMSQTFDASLRTNEFRVWKDGQSNSLIKKNYQYYDDNRLKFSSDSGDTYFRADSHRFDRSYSYDHAGKLSWAKTGAEARGETAPDRTLIPYKHDYVYNAFGNVTSRQTYTWTEADNKTHTWTNNRESTWGYDADGRLKSTPENRYYHDASGAVVMSTLNNTRRVIRHIDGEGRAVRRNDYTYSAQTHQYSLAKTEYFIYSTVLGKLLTEVKSNGTKKKTNVYGIGGVVATQNATGETTQHVAWENIDPSSASYMAVLPGGGAIYLGENGQAELDPLGSNVGLSNPDNLNVAGPGTRWGDPFGGYSCRVDGFEVPCSQMGMMLSSGAGTIDWNNSDHWALGSLGIFRGNGISQCESTDEICMIIEHLNGYSSYETLGLNLLALGAAQQSQQQINKDCQDALNKAGKTEQGLNRANDMFLTIQRLSSGDPWLASVVAAIGIVETDFLRINQQPSGPGRGIYQLEPKARGVTELQANNFNFATAKTAGDLIRNYSDIVGAYQQQFGQDYSSAQYFLLAGAIRTHNQWRSGVVAADGRGGLSVGALLQEAIRSQSLVPLDRGTSGGNNDYVTNVMSIFINCFGSSSRVY